VSEEYEDFRGKLTKLGWCYAEAERRTTGNDLSEIVRDIVHEWAERRHLAAIEAQKLMEAKGIAGNGRDSEGRPAK
jgi:hypothetical protein